MSPKNGTDRRSVPLTSVMMPPMTIVSPSGTLIVVWIVRVVRGGGMAPLTVPMKFETSSEQFKRR